MFMSEIHAVGPEETAEQCYLDNRQSGPSTDGSVSRDTGRGTSSSAWRDVPCCRASEKPWSARWPPGEHPSSLPEILLPRVKCRVASVSSVTPAHGERKTASLV